MTAAHARRRSSALELAAPPAVRVVAGMFADLDPTSVAFPRLIAQRIVAIPDLIELDQVLGFVPRDVYRVVETLALQGIAVRIAQIDARDNTLAARDAALELRRAELEKIPEDLRGRVEAWVKSYYTTKPWLYSKNKKVEQ